MQDSSERRSRSHLVSSLCTLSVFRQHLFPSGPMLNGSSGSSSVRPVISRRRTTGAAFADSQGRLKALHVSLQLLWAFHGDVDALKMTLA